MKKVFTSLTLACLLVLALCTWAQASDAPLALRVTVNGQTMGSSGLLLDPEESRTALAAIQPNDDNRPLAWRSSDSNIVSVTSSTDGRTGFIKGLNPGKATVTVSADGITPVNFEVTVSGIVTATDSITIKENEAVLLANVAELGLQTFGAVDGNASFTIATDKANVARATGRTLANLTVDGVAPGIARITITSTVGSKSYQKSFSVTVESNEAEPIRGDASTTNPLKFSTLESKIAAQCKELISGENNTLASITGVRVSPNEGILYLNYKSPGGLLPRLCGPGALHLGPGLRAQCPLPGGDGHYHLYRHLRRGPDLQGQDPGDPGGREHGPHHHRRPWEPSEALGHYV